MRLVSRTVKWHFSCTFGRGGPRTNLADASDTSFLRHVILLETLSNEKKVRGTRWYSLNRPAPHSRARYSRLVRPRTWSMRTVRARQGCAARSAPMIGTAAVSRWERPDSSFSPLLCSLYPWARTPHKRGQNLDVCRHDSGCGRLTCWGLFNYFDQLRALSSFLFLIKIYLCKWRFMGLNKIRK